MVKLLVRQVAEARGIENPNQLKTFLKCSYSTATRLWNGRPIPKLTRLAKLAEKFGCPVESLYSVNGTSRSNKVPRCTRT